MKKDFLSRREFIAKAGTGALAVVVLGPMMGARLLAGGRSGPKTMEPITIDLTDPHHAALTKVGGAIKIPNPLDKKKADHRDATIGNGVRGIFFQVHPPGLRGLASRKQRHHLPVS